jgi:hypothetical protein
MKRIFSKITVVSAVAAIAVSCSHRQNIEFEVNEHTGAINRISIAGDPGGMNWVIVPDNSQYAWIGKEYGWGLGEVTVGAAPEHKRYKWGDSLDIDRLNENSWLIHYYMDNNIAVSVKRKLQQGDLIEEYVFVNKGDRVAYLSDVSINTPFNDNYPDAETCYASRANAHIWAAGSASYVHAVRMGAYAPHLGLVLTEGALQGYEIKERARDKGMSNTRGVIALNPVDMALQPQESHTLSWRIFRHDGNEDFYGKILEYGSVAGSSDRYVYEAGDTVNVEFKAKNRIKTPKMLMNGEDIPFVVENNRVTAQYPVAKEGNMIFRLQYDGDKTAYVECLAVSGIDKLIKKRTGFIMNNQQLNNKEDLRDGAYMVYDNDTDRIYLNDTPNANPVDRDEGRERHGMGVLLALQYQATKDEKIKESLLKYSAFVHRLHDREYRLWSDAGRTSRNRAYNYPWAANYYFEMFNVTGDKQFLKDAYGILKALYRQFGHGFYAIDVPVKGYYLLKNNGFEDEAESLLEDFRQTAEIYLKNGWRYPGSEVNYEQSIVAPSIIHLLRMYAVTRDERYLKGAEEQLPLLEAFAGLQPSYRLNEIAVRHWDGYWFGKQEFWGDTFPHYWSTLSALAYSLYAECTGRESWQKRAENIVRNNLCLFFEDGKASCAYIYPLRVNGEKAKFYDSYANDQDWAMYYYFVVNSTKQNFKLTRF